MTWDILIVHPNRAFDAKRSHNGTIVVDHRSADEDTWQLLKITSFENHKKILDSILKDNLKSKI